MDVLPTLPLLSNKRIILQIQITRGFEIGLGFSSLLLQGKVLSRETKVMKYMPKVKLAELHNLGA